MFGHLFRRGRSIKERIVEMNRFVGGAWWLLLWLGRHGESNDSIVGGRIVAGCCCFRGLFPEGGRLGKRSPGCSFGIADLLQRALESYRCQHDDSTCSFLFCREIDKVCRIGLFATDGMEILLQDMR